MLPSSNGLGNLPFKQGDTGSNPVGSTKYALHLLNKPWVRVKHWMMTADKGWGLTEAQRLVYALHGSRKDHRAYPVT